MLWSLSLRHSVDSLLLKSRFWLVVSTIKSSLLIGQFEIFNLFSFTYHVDTNWPSSSIWNDIGKFGRVLADRLDFWKSRWLDNQWIPVSRQWTSLFQFWSADSRIVLWRQNWPRTSPAAPPISERNRAWKIMNVRFKFYAHFIVIWSLEIVEHVGWRHIDLKSG